MQPLRTHVFPLLKRNRSRLARRFFTGLAALLWLIPVESAEICNNISNKSFVNETITSESICTATIISVGSDVTIADDVTFNYIHQVGFTGPVTVEGRLRLATSRSPLNDTGITFGGDYPYGNNSDCSSNIAAPQDCHQGRDATHNDASDGHAGFSFTKLDAQGNPLPASASSWSCVKDNVTGLIWEVKTDDGGIHDRDNTYRWGGKTALGSAYGDYYDDWDSLVDGSNAEQLCGYSDWRVPTLTELQSIVNYDNYFPVIDADYFPNTPFARFWSSSPSANSSAYAWNVYFGYGYAYNDYRDLSKRLRLVRAGQ